MEAHGPCGLGLGPFIWNEVGAATLTPNSSLLATRFLQVQQDQVATIIGERPQ